MNSHQNKMATLALSFVCLSTNVVFGNALMMKPGRVVISLGGVSDENGTSLTLNCTGGPNGSCRRPSQPNTRVKEHRKKAPAQPESPSVKALPRQVSLPTGLLSPAADGTRTAAPQAPAEEKVEAPGPFRKWDHVTFNFKTAEHAELFNGVTGIVMGQNSSDSQRYDVLAVHGGKPLQFSVRPQNLQRYHGELEPQLQALEDYRVQQEDERRALAAEEEENSSTVEETKGPIEGENEWNSRSEEEKKEFVLQLMAVLGDLSMQQQQIPAPTNSATPQQQQQHDIINTMIRLD